MKLKAFLIFPNNGFDYVNSQWEKQKEPYSGDVINSYNDGSLDRKSMAQSTFYELESSSPAKELKPGESVKHYHRTFHFEGKKEDLSKISKVILGAGIDEILRHTGR